MVTITPPHSRKLVRIPGTATIARKLLRNAFGQQNQVGITLKDPDGTHFVGSSDSMQQYTIEIRSKLFYQRLLSRGDLGVAESYIAGEWSCSNLGELFITLLSHAPSLKKILRKYSWLGNILPRFFHSRRHNSVTRSRHNISKHYDLGNEFYKLFLDDTLCYSSGLFNRDRMGMREASEQKMKSACEFLGLTADDHLLEIGTGWGGLAVYAAENYGCRVTSTTISKEQFDFSRTLVQTRGLADRVSIIDRDYRELTGTYDKLVSIEMIEAVGYEYLDAFFTKCSSLLTADGKMLLQSILMNDDDYDNYLASIDFIRYYVFPGGCLPSLKRIHEINHQQTPFRLIESLDMSTSYVRTLEHWLDRFQAAAKQVNDLGYDPSFQRLWQYYLEYCRAGFSTRHITVSQMLFERA